MRSVFWQYKRLNKYAPYRTRAVERGFQKTQKSKFYFLGLKKPLKIQILDTKSQEKIVAFHAS